LGDEKEDRAKKIHEEIMDENVPRLAKYISSYVQGT
jgi:hypothetical protein